MMRGREHEILSQARRTLGGLEFFARMIAGELPLPPMVALLGFRIAEIAPGRAVLEADPAAAYYNGHGSVHGGFAAALLDTALGFAVNSTMPAGRAYATLELKTTLIRALNEAVGPVRCIATAVHLGSRVATAEGRIVDASDRIYAQGSATSLAIETAVVEPLGESPPGPRGAAP
jgi:uncharacterized protein (TIGR00369 family)